MIILMDLTRLYFSVKKKGRPLDYEKLVRVLEEESGESAEEVICWTVTIPESKAQRRFLRELREELDFEIFEEPAYKARINLRPSRAFDEDNTRFDAEISFALARLVEETDVIVVSDSWPLRKPIRQAIDRSNHKVFLAAFRSAMDARWDDELDKVPNFINLDSFKVFDFRQDSGSFDDLDLIP